MSPARFSSPVDSGRRGGALGLADGAPERGGVALRVLVHEVTDGCFELDRLPLVPRCGDDLRVPVMTVHTELDDGELDDVLEGRTEPAWAGRQVEPPRLRPLARVCAEVTDGRRFRMELHV